MLGLTFKQTQAEMMVRAASTIIFSALNRAGFPTVALAEVAEDPQYGFTASASLEEIGPKFVRITDLHDGEIDWAKVPYCKCDEPEKYLLKNNDILFARTGATTGKTHLVNQSSNAVFASYLIRIRSKGQVYPEYLYSFFQSNNYWSQLLEEKEGSAQPNVNGQKLLRIQLPILDHNLQLAISTFLKAVRDRQDGLDNELPELPPPLAEQRRVVARIEELAAKIEEARGLRRAAVEEGDSWVSSLHLSLAQERVIQLNQIVVLDECREIIEPGHQYPQVGVKGFGQGLFAKQAVSASETTYKAFNRLYDGALVLSQVKGWEGAIAVCDNKLAGWYVSPEYRTFRFIPNQAIPEYMAALVATPWFWRQLQHMSKGLGGRRERTRPEQFLQLRIPMPLVDQQIQAIGLFQRFGHVKALQAATQAELDALLPAVLDKAFRGEL